MSKAVKNLLANDIKSRLGSAQDCVVGNMIGLDSELTVVLRRRLRAKNINVMVIKNSLARRATAGTALGPAFEGLQGTAAVLFGGEDFIALIKEVTELDKDDKFAAFKARGGVMDGERLTPEKVLDISKWPNRREQLSILAGQLTAPWRRLQSQLTSPSGILASQIKQKGGEESP